MGTFIPVAFQALQAFQTISSISGSMSGGSDSLALKQLQQQQNLQQEQAYQDALLQKQQINIQSQEAELTRKAALKRAVARNRASFGASGVGNGTGSTEAVLLGLFEESEEEKASRQKLDNLKLKSIDQNLYQQSRVNTLKKTQLAQKEKLKNSSSLFEVGNDILNIF